MKVIILFSTAVAFLLFSSCELQEKLPQDFMNGIEQIRAEKAPDKRTSIFQVDSEYKDNHWVISAESSVPAIEADIRNLVTENFETDEVEFSFIILPPAEFADTTHGIVSVSVANLRRHPGHTAELVDQVLIGTELKLLRAKGYYWYQVQTPYDYIGWISRVSLQRMDSSAFRNWQQARKVAVSTNFAQVFSKPSEKSQTISDAVLGAVFIEGAAKRAWTEVIFPDNRIGFMQSSKLIPYKSPNNASDLNREEITIWSKKMMGIPYLWGGHSTKGFDCSGFTSTVFLTQGYQLPRDANMQAQLGEEIIPKEDYSNILPGDLIFFGPSEDRITHVGICMGGPNYIHESGDVHINSLDPEDELFDPHRKETLQYIKRIIKN